MGPAADSREPAGTLVHHDGALGDVLLSLPALRVLRERCGPLHLAARQDVSDLLCGLGLVEKTHSPGSAVFLSLHQEQPDEAAGRFVGRFGGVAVFTGRPDSPLAAAMKRLKPDALSVVTVPPEEAATHVSPFRLRQVEEALGVGSTSFPPAGRSPLCHLPGIPEAEGERARHYLSAAGWDGAQPVVIVQPGSGGRRKCWPLERFLECARQLMGRQGAFVCLVTGPAEEDYGPALDGFVETVPGRAVRVRGEGLLFIAALLSCASVYLGNDSGISHLAGLAGCPAVVVFGPTDPVRWMPSGEDVRVVSVPCECAPCGDRLSRECRDRRCLTAVPVDRVLREAEGLLGVRRPEQRTSCR